MRCTAPECEARGQLESEILANGNVTGNEKLQAEGKAQELEGKTQRTVGEAKDGVKNAADAVKSKL